MNRPLNKSTAIYSPAQVRALDAYEIEKRRVPGFTLMTRAADGALELLRARWPQARRVAVVCGAGNNGGDGYVLARLAQAAGLEVLPVRLPNYRSRCDTIRRGSLDGAGAITWLRACHRAPSSRDAGSNRHGPHRAWSITTTRRN